MSKHPVQRVLFVCLHGAAKSVLAGSYFNALAGSEGLDARATSRGVEPDDDIPPRVRQLHGDGLCVERPALLTEADIDAADVVVSFDLDEGELGAVPDVTWNGLPAVSQDFDRARIEIEERVQGLVQELRRGRTAVDAERPGR